MHILVAAHDLYPDPSSGGTGRYVYETSRRFVLRGHRVSVITRRRGDVPRAETLDGIRVRRYDVAIAGRSAPTILRQLPGVARTVAAHVRELGAAEPVDLVSFQGPVTSLLVDAAVPDETPRICTFHSPWPTEYDVKTHADPDRSALRRRLNIRLRRALERRVVEGADARITLSEYMRQQLRRVYDSTADATVVPGGVDLDRFSPDAGAYPPMETDGPALLTVRRLTPRMGHELLLKAFSRVADEHGDARLYVAGEGELRPRLEALAADLGVADRTAFLGYVPDADLPAAYASADLFVLPTTQLEGFGLATLEALASGTPVAATPVGGTVEVLSGLDGTPARPLADAATTEALAATLDAWLTADSSAVAVAGRTCREYAASHYTWDRTADSLESEYERRIEAAD